MNNEGPPMVCVVDWLRAVLGHPCDYEIELPDGDPLRLHAGHLLLLRTPGRELPLPIAGTQYNFVAHVHIDAIRGRDVLAWRNVYEVVSDLQFNEHGDLVLPRKKLVYNG